MLSASPQGALSVAERYRRNIAAVETLKRLQEAGRSATDEEKQVLAQYTGWGAGDLSEIFNEANRETEPDRFELKELLGEESYRQAARGVNYAHYTDPTYTKAVWQGLKKYGFSGGQVLEPGSGIGNFISQAPADTRVTGIEIDPTSAAISAYLYPEATIRNESFADSFIPNGYFDAAIGNVPFSQTVLHDPRHNAAGHSMHNHFIIKSLNLTKPGGMVALITSTGTLDAAGSSAREAMYAQADLMGAYRLPERAFDNAGTTVMTDLLIFRKRLENETPLSDVWITSKQYSTEDGLTYHRNAYFEDAPQNLLGETVLKTNRFGQISEAVTATAQKRATLSQRLAQAIEADAQVAITAGRAYSTEPAKASESMPLLLPGEGLLDQHISVHPNGTFTIYQEKEQRPLRVPKTQEQELKSLLSLRDQTKTLLAAEATDAVPETAMEAARTQLRETYHRHTDKYGPLNGGTLTYTQSGETRVRRRPVMSTFLKDPAGALVLGLENYSQATNSATPADLLNHRILEPRKPVTHVDNALDALAVSLDVKGGVDIQYMAELMKDSTEAVISELGDRIFVLPSSSAEAPQYQTAEEYLSGNVKAKLKEAQAAAERNPHFTKHVQALEKAIPEDIAAADITVQPGAVWIPEAVHEQFLHEELGDMRANLRRVHGGMWELTNSSSADPNNYGTPERSPAQLFQAAIEKKPIRIITDKAFNPEATAHANAQAEKISDRFAEWVWEDPERHQMLLRAYNDTHNNYALRSYAEAGKALTLPGLVKTFTPHAHQRTAIARMINEPSVGLFHEVGAGKTAEMVIGTMELKRLGLIKKPAILVPNHMLEQFSREWLELYPQARLLAASSSDIGSGDKHRQFIARVATNDWDAVIMTHVAFNKLQLSNEGQAAYLQKEVDLMEHALYKHNERAASSGKETRSTKQLQERMERLEEQIKNLLSSPSPVGISFEETGIDYLCVDEMHEFKNLKTFSSIPGVQIEGSKKATNLHSVVEYLRETNGNRVITAATGTPVANSMAELYVMNRYLAPELLREQGLEDFDSWAATYGKTVTEMELTVAGGDSYKMNTRFSKFVNIPELVRTMHTYADVKLADDLSYLKRPELEPNEKGEAAPHILSLKRSPEQAAYIEHLADRYEALSGRAEKGADNPLVITSDGRKVAADYRLIDPAATPTGEVPTKSEATAQVLAEVYEKNKNRNYLIPGTDQEHPNPGALQVVFCDYGVPGKDRGFDMYNELKQQCVIAGIPEDKIRFIQDADTEAKKAKLFQQCRDGEVAVLIGSTSRMGTGTNIQNRLVHLVHMDAPWRPADLEQRDGRILRPGNQNQQVRITQVVTSETFDAVMWSTLLRKQRFISQVMRGDMSIRTMEDLGKSEVSMAQTQAIATGNPFIMKHSEAVAKVRKLRSIMSGHENGRRLAQFQYDTLSARTKVLEDQIPAMKQAAGQVVETTGDKFSAVMNGKLFDSRVDVAEALKQWADGIGSPSWVRATQLGEVITIGGLNFVGVLQAATPGHISKTPVTLHVQDMPWVKVETGYAEMKQVNRGLVTRLENAVSSIAMKAESLEKELVKAKELLPGYKAKAEVPFAQVEQVRLAEAEELRLRQMVEKFKTADDQVRSQMLMESQQEEISLVTDSVEKLGEKAMEQATMEKVLPSLTEAMEQISEQTGIKYWHDETAFEETEMKIDSSGYKYGEDRAILYDELNAGLTGIDVVALYDVKDNKVQGFLLETPTEQKRFSNVDELKVGVQSSYLEYNHRELTNRAQELQKNLKEAWDEYGKAEGDLAKIKASESSVKASIDERESLIEQQAVTDFARLRSAEQEVEKAGIFNRTKRQDEFKHLKAEISQKYHGASEAYQAMKWAKENDEELASWKKHLSEVSSSKEAKAQELSEVRGKIQVADEKLKAVQVKAEELKRQRQATDPVLRSQQRVAMAASVQHANQDRRMGKVQGLVR
ncbi:helicase-related protein [Rothia sp. P5764]|uniref:helicase-related protein n=1 Tax=Rothia sp. P5764 TaxID=3402654 RepID=UPI003AC0A582